MTTYQVKCRRIVNLPDATLCDTRSVAGLAVAGDRIECECGRVMEVDLVMIEKLDDQFEETGEWGPALVFKTIRQPPPRGGEREDG